MIYFKTYVDKIKIYLYIIVMTTREVIKLLEKNGFVFVGQNKHAKYKKGNISIPVPKHKGDLPIGTLNSILKQAGLK